MIGAKALLVILSVTLTLAHVVSGISVVHELLTLIGFYIIIFKIKLFNVFE